METFRQLLRIAFTILAVAALPISADAEPVSGVAPAQASANLPAFPKFEIARFDVSGNSLLDPSAMERILSPFTGKNKSFGDIQLALEALQQAYVTAGYGAVQVRLPEQDMEQGTVRFLVVEGKVKNILVKGNAFHNEANIRASVPELKLDSSPKAAKIELNLKAANENPSKKAQVLLKSTDNPGEIDATLQVVDEKPWKVGALLDNTGNPETGMARLGVFMQNSNVANRDHVLTMQYTTSPAKPGDVKVFGAGYHVPIYSLGDSFQVYAGHSDVNSGTLQSLFSVSGSGDVVGARYNHNLSRHGDYDHKLVFGIDQRDYRNNVLIGGGGASLVPDISVHPLSLSYVGEWHLPNQQFSLYLTEAGNLKGGSKGGDVDFANIFAKADYMLTRLGAEYSRHFGNDWQAHVALGGQYTQDVLVAGERFGIGGASSVRGYYERELANDRGYRGSLELYTPDFGEQMHSGSALKMRALIFHDFAEVSPNKALAGGTEMPRSSIGSIGMGLRATVDKNFLLQADLAHTLKAGGRQSKHQSRIHFGMVVSY